MTMASSLQPGALSCSAGFDALFAAIDASCGQLPTTQQQPAPPPQSQSAAGWSVSAPAVSGGSTGAAVAAASPKLPHAGVFTSWPPGAATAGGVGGTAAVQPFGSASPPSQPWGLVSGRGNTGSSRGNESGSDSNTLGELGAMSASRSAAAPDHGHPSPSPRHRLSRRADTEEEHEEAGWSSSGGWSTSASADADLGDAEASSRTSLLPLASVPVPPLDNKHLPPALRQVILLPFVVEPSLPVTPSLPLATFFSWRVPRAHRCNVRFTTSVTAVLFRSSTLDVLLRGCAFVSRVEGGGVLSCFFVHTTWDIDLDAFYPLSNVLCDADCRPQSARVGRRGDRWTGTPETEGGQNGGVRV